MEGGEARHPSRFLQLRMVSLPKCLLAGDQRAVGERCPVGERCRLREAGTNRTSGWDVGPETEDSFQDKVTPSLPSATGVPIGAPSNSNTSTLKRDLYNTALFHSTNRQLYQHQVYLITLQYSLEHTLRDAAQWKFLSADSCGSIRRERGLLSASVLPSARRCSTGRPACSLRG